jgi:hypothetical protein
MEGKKPNHGGRRTATLMVGVALILACSSASRVIDPYETTGSISGVSQPASKIPSIPKIECPGMDIRPGASTLDITVRPDQTASGDLRYQLSLERSARECRVQDGAMSIKVGVQGYAVLGPFGTPGSVDVPLRYAVVREGPQPKVIVTKLKRIRATIAPGKTHAQFVDIEGGLSFPLPSNAELTAYVVYVGFEEAKNVARSH